MTEPFRVLVTCGIFEPGHRGGGPIRSVARIVDSAPDTVVTTLITKDRDLGMKQPYPGLSGRWVKRGRTEVFYLDHRSVRQWFHLWRRLRATHFDLLYTNSLWAPIDTLLPIVAVWLRLLQARDVLIAPRGELSPGALELKARKKRLFLMWWRPFLRHRKVRWHASTELEAVDIRAVFPWANVDVNGDMAALPMHPVPVIPTDPHPLRLVYIGRISPKKNVDMTLAALALVRARVDFDIYGPIEDRKYWARCLELINHIPAAVQVEYRGEILPSEVTSMFSGHDAFVFPTRGENFGHVIAESLAGSCPVICSDRTPWGAVLEAGGGIVLAELTAECVAAEVERLAALDAQQRSQARMAAGAVYRQWRLGSEEPNILEQMRVRVGVR